MKREFVMRGTKGWAQRRYLIRLGISMGAYIVTLALALRLVGSGTVTGPPAIALALLPGISVAGVFWAIGRLLVEESDEYLRMLLVRQTLVATGFTLTLTTMWGFLENFDLVSHVDAFYITVLWFAGLGVGSCYNWLTLGRTGEPS
jgi:uncharacterized membrane protein YcfT